MDEQKVGIIEDESPELSTLKKVRNSFSALMSGMRRAKVSKHRSMEPNHSENKKWKKSRRDMQKASRKANRG